VNTRVYPQGRYDLYFYAEGVSLRREDKGGIKGGGQKIRWEMGIIIGKAAKILAKAINAIYSEWT